MVLKDMETQERAFEWHRSTMGRQELSTTDFLHFYKSITKNEALKELSFLTISQSAVVSWLGLFKWAMSPPSGKWKPSLRKGMWLCQWVSGCVIHQKQVVIPCYLMITSKAVLLGSHICLRKNNMFFTFANLSLKCLIILSTQIRCSTYICMYGHKTGQGCLGIKNR